MTRTFIRSSHSFLLPRDGNIFERVLSFNLHIMLWSMRNSNWREEGAKAPWEKANLSSRANWFVFTSYRSNSIAVSLKSITPRDICAIVEANWKWLWWLSQLCHNERLPKSFRAMAKLLGLLHAQSSLRTSKLEACGFFVASILKPHRFQPFAFRLPEVCIVDASNRDVYDRSQHLKIPSLFGVC